MHAPRWRLGLPLAIGAVAVVATAASGVVYDAWQTATPVAPVNSGATEGCPIESPDGLSLYIMSTRGTGGDQDIWVATRESRDQAFGAPQELAEPVNSAANDFCPTPLRGNRLLFVSNRGGTDAYGTAACGGGDIYLTRRSTVTGEWSAPRNLGCIDDGGPNGTGTEYGPSLVETDAGTQLYFSSGGLVGGNTQEIYRSDRAADGTFGPPQPVTELNTGVDDFMPNLRKDGLEIVFASNRSGGQGAFDIWTSTRSSVLDPWSVPVNVGTAVNTVAPETRPSLSWDGRRLYVGRAGDIYVSTRTR